MYVYGHNTTYYKIYAHLKLMATTVDIIFHKTKGTLFIASLCIHTVINVRYNSDALFTKVVMRFAYIVEVSHTYNPKSLQKEVYIALII